MVFKTNRKGFLLVVNRLDQPDFRVKISGIQLSWTENTLCCKHTLYGKKNLQILKHKNLETPGEQADATQEWKGRDFHHTFASFDTSLLCVQLRFCGADVAAGFSLGACLITGMTKHLLCQIVEVLQSPRKTTK